MFDQSWKKKEEEDRKVLYKLLLTRAKNQRLTGKQKHSKLCVR